MNKCENCEVEHDGEYGSGRFCSSTCAKGFSTKGKRSLINDKVKLKLTIDPYKKICKQCQMQFETKNKRLLFCSNSCSGTYKGQDKNIKRKLSLAAKKNVKNGTHVGWQSRKIRSYAELFFEKVLNNNQLIFSTEYKISKKLLGIECNSNYFLDFYFEDKKIDLEIDGKQHSYPDRIASDEIRDAALKRYGIEVYRIKWKNPNNKQNKQYIKTEINNFLNFYKFL